jgi:hypothetical protein
VNARRSLDLRIIILCKYRPFLLVVNAKEVRHGRAESLLDGNQIKQQEMRVQKRKIRDFFID